MPFDALSRDFSLKLNAIAHVQVGAIPIRWLDGAPQVLLVTTRGRGHWIVPKGWPLGDCPDCESARRQAYEEAGVVGRIETYSLGQFEYWKGEGKKRAFFHAHAFALHVDQVLPHWPSATPASAAGSRSKAPPTWSVPISAL
jgi:8-oxo-dGTP pyrophosphatase MutT (NUDIX family)